MKYYINIFIEEIKLRVVHMDNSSLFCDKTLRYIDLWQSVISQVFADSISKGKSPKARLYRKRARKWIIEADQDFHLVCALANMSPRLVQKMFLIKIKEFCGEDEYKEIADAMIFHNTLQDDSHVLQFIDNIKCEENFMAGDNHVYKHMVNWGFAI